MRRFELILFSLLYLNYFLRDANYFNLIHYMIFCHCNIDLNKAYNDKKITLTPYMLTLLTA